MTTFFLRMFQELCLKGLKKAGIKNDLIARETNCINAGNDENIFLGVDGGKWYDAKNNLIQQPQASSRDTSFSSTELKWGKFPSCRIPKYFNKGHIFTFIVNENIECEDPEVDDMQTKITVEPIKRGHQYVDSDHITEVQDAQEDNYYICQCKYLASFQIFIKYTITVILNRTPGAIIKGMCECKQSAIGKCSHVTALLIFISEYSEKYKNIVPSPSLPREWGCGSEKHNPIDIKSAEFPIKRFKTIQRGNFDPRPKEYIRTIDTNYLISELQTTEANSGLLAVSNLIYKDYAYSEEEIDILTLQCQQYLKNIRDFALNQDSTLFVIPGTEQGSEEWLRWRTFYIISTSAKIVATQLISSNAKKTHILKNLWRTNKPSTTKAMYHGK
ncbi:hypothetical protein JTB14_020828 [Gonioctena quinquepunctata]|nr:hypothetical protein JTB14_020828 [Gonioctena quinquepunctata]